MKPALPGWKVECVGDDIAWMKFDSQGERQEDGSQTQALCRWCSKPACDPLSRLSLQVNLELSTQRTVSSVWLQAPRIRPTPTPCPPLPKTLCSPTLARPAMEEYGGRALTPLQLGSHSQTGTAKAGSKVTSAGLCQDSINSKISRRWFVFATSFLMNIYQFYRL